MRTASGGRVLFSYGGTDEPGAGRRRADYLDRLCEGRDITAITHVRGSGFIWGLQSHFPFRGETWNALRKMDLRGRLQAIDDSETAARLIAEVKPGKQDGLENVFYMGSGETPEYTVSRDQSVKAICEARGESFVEAFIRLSRESAGRGLFTVRIFNKDLDELGELIKSRHVFPCLGDAGAHVSQIMDAGWPSFVISHWIRDRGLYSLGEGIRRLTSGPARVIGLTDRGTLAEGMRADINVFDLDAVAELQPELVHDFPGGAPRYIQRARGYKATLVNGEINVVDGEHTGVRAGRVLRHTGA